MANRDIEAIRRGRSQVFSRFLPGAVQSLDGETVEVTFHALTGFAGQNVSESYIRARIREEVARWPYRRNDFDRLIADANSEHYELVVTQRVFAKPVGVYECERCKAAVAAVAARTGGGRCDRATAPGRPCGGRLRVLPFVAVHQCGVLRDLTVPECGTGRGHGRRYMVLDRYGRRRWACRIPGCGWTQNVFGLPCARTCELRHIVGVPRRGLNAEVRNVGDPSVHRLQDVDFFLSSDRAVGDMMSRFGTDAERVFVARHLGLLPATLTGAGDVLSALHDLSLRGPASPTINGFAEVEKTLRKTLTGSALDDALGKLRAAVEASVSPRERAMRDLDIALTHADAHFVGGVAALDVGARANAREIMIVDSLPGRLSIDRMHVQVLGRGPSAAGYAVHLRAASDLAERGGIADVSYIPRLPVLSAAYGFTRLRPKTVNGSVIPDVLCTFGRATSTRGRTDKIWPIFTLSTETEAIMVRLSSARVFAWLVENGFVSSQEAEALRSERERRAWLLARCRNIGFDTLPSEVDPAFFATATLVHSMSHSLMKEIASQSSFAQTSISEMVLPATLGTVIYVNRQNDFVLGGMRTFMEQRFDSALQLAQRDESCPLDPGCSAAGARCQQCMFVPEICCPWMNNALSRTVLHGGELIDGNPLGSFFFQDHAIGYWSSNVKQRAERLFG